MKTRYFITNFYKAPHFIWECQDDKVTIISLSDKKRKQCSYSTSYLERHPDKKEILKSEAALLL